MSTPRRVALGFLLLVGAGALGLALATLTTYDDPSAALLLGGGWSIQSFVAVALVWVGALVGYRVMIGEANETFLTLPALAALITVTALVFGLGISSGGVPLLARLLPSLTVGQVAFALFDVAHFVLAARIGLFHRPTLYPSLRQSAV